MEHIAIDLGSRESQICVRSSDGAVQEEVRLPTRPAMRAVLVQAAHAAMRSKRKNDPMVRWANRVAVRRGRKDRPATS